MSDLPRMLYRKGGDDDVFGLKCETCIVETDVDEAEAYTDGWSRTPFEAHGVEPPKPDAIEDQPPMDDEKLGLLDELDETRRDVVSLREQLTAANEALKQAESELAETRKLLEEATKPAEKQKPKETLGIKAG